MNHHRTRKHLKLCSCTDPYQPSNEQEVFEKDVQQTAKYDHQTSLKGRGPVSVPTSCLSWLSHLAWTYLRQLTRLRQFLYRPPFSQTGSTHAITKNTKETRCSHSAETLTDFISIVSEAQPKPDGGYVLCGYGSIPGSCSQ